MYIILVGLIFRTHRPGESLKQTNKSSDEYPTPQRCSVSIVYIGTLCAQHRPRGLYSYFAFVVDRDQVTARSNYETVYEHNINILDMLHIDTKIMPIARSIYICHRCYAI